MTTTRTPTFLVNASAAASYVVVLTLIALWMPLMLLAVALTAPFDPTRRIPGRLLRVVGASPTYVFPYWHVRIEGRQPRQGAFVCVSNHQSFLDIFAMSRFRREMKWMAKEELFKIPYLGYMFTLAGDIRLLRGDRDSGDAALARARWYLDHGMPVMIFPEGTRSKDGKLLPFKTGAFRLAADAGVPVVPVAVCGSAHGMPKGSPWIRPARVRIRILEPIETKGMSGHEVVKLKVAARERIAAALAEMQADEGRASA